MNKDDKKYIDAVLSFCGIPADHDLYNGNFYTHIGDATKYEKGIKNQCFTNAYSLVEQHDDLIYCEGIAMSDRMHFPFHHAWCVNNEDVVIDNTWDDGVFYFGIPFVKFTISALKQYDAGKPILKGF